jgi:xanthine phosphoribosyltransferase
MEHYYYRYDEYLADAQALAEKIEGKPDAIIAIARGGMTLAHMLGEHYDIREVYTINTIGYDGDKKLDTTIVFNIPDIKGSKRVLIVDDIVDSGETMKLVLETLAARYPECTFHSAALFYKDTAVMKPDWYVHDAKKWIDFFWSEDL